VGKFHFSIFMLITAAIGGCATSAQMESGLNSLIGRNEQDAFAVLGYPSGKQQFGKDTVYIWEISSTGTLLLPQTVTTYGTVGTIPVYGATTYNQAIPISSNCLIKIAANPAGTLINWEYRGDWSGCSSYINRLGSYHKSSIDSFELKSVEATPPEGVTLNQKKNWVRVVAERNGCVNTSDITLSSTNEVREFFTVSCTNKTMEIVCAFAGPVKTGPGGAPFVSVTGEWFDKQPACWQEGSH
jgi:hypothetical protein